MLLQAPAERACAKFVAGATVAGIQAVNLRPIKQATIVRYIAAVAERDPKLIDFARLAREAGLTYHTAAAIASGKPLSHDMVPLQRALYSITLSVHAVDHFWHGRPMPWVCAGITASDSGNAEDVWSRSGCQTLPPTLNVEVAVQLVAAMALAGEHWFADDGTEAREVTPACVAAVTPVSP